MSISNLDEKSRVGCDESKYSEMFLVSVGVVFFFLFFSVIYYLFYKL
jgi:hypothetical protein